MKSYLTVLISLNAVIDINDKISLSKQKGYHLASFHCEAELNPFTYLKTDDPVSINRIYVDKRTPQLSLVKTFDHVRSSSQLGRVFGVSDLATMQTNLLSTPRLA